MFANYSPFLALSTLGSPAVCLNDDMAKFSYILARTRLAIFPLRAQHVVRMAFRTTRSQCEGYIYIYVGVLCTETKDTFLVLQYPLHVLKATIVHRKSERECGNRDFMLFRIVL